jgi:hypothetical protein
MSAAATAAGYLYASGRLRGKGAREGAGAEAEQHREAAPQKAKRRELRVAVYAPEAPKQEPGVKKSPKIEYRTRRWRPE